MRKTINEYLKSRKYLRRIYLILVVIVALPPCIVGTALMRAFEFGCDTLRDLKEYW